ncbi:hypothetical protein LHYA1_G005417 [Lachnellula hyalina]|uniref:Acyltransferase 3 domain-containing protein n=1 Tax=Lachnellula hyalina TaxID=1316788 RepID=A0A8H8TWV8_9HELO|nr:uncharacterized protein LHYA1_G005417 [Lachnellula hyalina]TVY25344.1 hypothetical protein LHYA1_G005417 [Lachnellula hyalina]
MGQTNSRPSAPEPGRLYHLDNFRTFLTALVIYHHTSIPYGGLGTWQYISPHHVQGSSPSLTAFNALNQTFFMGSFFYMSGVMSFQSLKKKKSISQFLKTKWIKLGIPAALYTLLAPPTQIAVIRLLRGTNADFWELLIGHLKALRSVRGPVWYSSLLLVFDTAYSLLPQIALPNLGFWPAMILDIAACSLLRIPNLAHKVFAPLSVRSDYFPQYLIAYILGTCSGPKDPASPPPPPLLTPGRRNALLATSVLSGSYIIGLLRSRAGPESYSFVFLDSGFNAVSVAYAVWNESTGFLLGASLMNLFERKEWGRRRWRSVGRYSYAAFLVHPIICVGVQAAAEDWGAGGLLKSIVCGSVGVVGSWAVAWGMVRIPGVGKVLF